MPEQSMSVNGGTPSVLGLLKMGRVRILAGILIGLVLAAGTSLAREDAYTARAFLVVVPTEREGAGAATQFGQVFARVASAPAVLSGAVGDVPGAVAPQDLAEAVTMSASPNAPLVEVSGEAASPEAAAVLTNAVAGAIARYSAERADGTGYRLESLVEAVAPTRPSSPGPRLVLLLGAVLGGSAGVLVALARDPLQLSRAERRAVRAADASDAAGDTGRSRVVLHRRTGSDRGEQQHRRARSTDPEQTVAETIVP